MGYQARAEIFVRRTKHLVSVCPTRQAQKAQTKELSRPEVCLVFKSFVPFVPLLWPDLFCAFWWLLYEAVADGVVGEFGVGFHVHFVEDTTSVSADRLVT